MAIQYPSFGGSDWSTGVPDYAKAVSNGLTNYINANKAQYAPKNEQSLAKQNEIAAQYAEPNAQMQLRLKEGELSSLPFRQKLMEAQAQRAQQLVSDPFGGHVPGGAVGQAYWVDKLKSQYGAESDVVKNAEKQIELENQFKTGLMDYRKTLANTSGTRSLTSLGKLEAEERDVADGFEPGTNRQVQISPDRQEDLLGKYALQKQKTVTDLDTRKRALFATNIDKTIDNIDVPSLVQFGGLSGGIVKKMNEGKALTGNEEESYRKYNESLTAAKLLQKQVRQFYGDSITPQIQEGLAELVNPASWANNPAIATRRFNQFVKILKSETQTYKEALKNKRPFEMPGDNGAHEMTYNPATGRLE